MRVVSQQTIAKLLNLSPGTVSRSLSNDPAISDDTRAKVLQKAQEIGYNFSRGGRRKTSGRTLTVGVIVGVRDSAPGTSTFPFILRGLQDKAAEEGITVEVRFQNPDHFDASQKGNEVFRQIRSSDWRGAIMIYPFAAEAIQAVVRRIPTVVALEDYVDLGVDSIDTDQNSGTLLLIEQLVKAGHKRIGFSAWVYPVPGHWTQRRFSAYMEGLYTHGLPFNPEFTINVDRSKPVLSKDEISARVAALVRKKKVTAWVCAADHQAYPLIYDLQMHGIRVPEDCSVTGYDGIAPVAGMKQVATIRVPHEEIGASALSRLLYRMSRPTAFTAKLLLRAELCAGETIGPAS
jgi:DNA-binding LacI/PurR family transcriptional regulator